MKEEHRRLIGDVAFPTVVLTTIAFGIVLLLNFNISMQRNVPVYPASPNVDLMMDGCKFAAFPNTTIGVELHDVPLDFITDKESRAIYLANCSYVKIIVEEKNSAQYLRWANAQK